MDKHSVIIPRKELEELELKATIADRLIKGARFLSSESVTLSGDSSPILEMKMSDLELKNLLRASDIVSHLNFRDLVDSRGNFIDNYKAIGHSKLLIRLE